MKEILFLSERNLLKCLAVSDKSSIFANQNNARMEKLPIHNNANDTAMLTSNADVTMFKYQDLNIRFKTSPYLERYTSVKEWDNGYIVVMAKYKGVGEVEEYIDLLPILDNLYIDKEKFLQNIKNVEVSYD